MRAEELRQAARLIVHEIRDGIASANYDTSRVADNLADFIRAVIREEVRESALRRK